MKKYDINAAGNIIEVPDQEFYLLLKGFVNSCAGFIEGNIGNHVSGLADFNQKYVKSTWVQITNIFSVAREGVEDRELIEYLIKLLGLVKTLVEEDDQIILAYQQAILQVRRSKKPIRNLELEVYRYRYEKQMPIPEIIYDIGKNAATHISQLKEIKAKLDSRLDQLISSQ